jgi:hypothetical protein
MFRQSDQPAPTIDQDLPLEAFGSVISREETLDLPSSTSVDARVVMENTESLNFNPLQAAVGMFPSPFRRACDNASNQSEPQ